MGLYKREQCFVIVAAALVLVGAVFLIVQAFGGYMWALWTGFGFVIAGALLYIAIQVQHIRFKKKYTAKESEIKAVAEKETTAKKA